MNKKEKLISLFEDKIGNNSSIATTYINHINNGSLD